MRSLCDNGYKLIKTSSRVKTLKVFVEELQNACLFLKNDFSSIGTHFIYASVTSASEVRSKICGFTDTELEVVGSVFVDRSQGLLHCQSKKHQFTQVMPVAATMALKCQRGNMV